MISPERFWTKVDVRGPDDCWLWNAATNARGYGAFTIDARNRARKSHRVAFFLTHGRWPSPCCLHRCDNPLCVNPRHLFEGTQADNIADMRAKGRQVYFVGSAHPRAKVSDRDVQIIRLLCGRIGCSYREVAARYGVSHGLISDIVNRKCWTQVKEIQL